MQSSASQTYKTTPAATSDTQGSNPPPATAMSQPITTCSVRSPPEPYDGKLENATTFWQVLDNYYTMNSVVFTNESKQVTTALTHFKHRTPMGKWASDQMEYHYKLKRL